MIIKQNMSLDVATLKEKYREKSLSEYGGLKEHAYYVEDFLDEQRLPYLVFKVDEGEYDFTPDGVRFLHECYGMDNIVKMILHEVGKGVPYNNDTPEEIKSWILSYLNGENL